MRRVRERGPGVVTSAILFLIAMSIGLFFAITKEIPFRSHFELKAAFRDSNRLRVGSPVRIAGVDVGKVEEIERGGDSAAIVTMRIEDEGLPLQKDATLKIRPRLFLEGNFFVDLAPGTPGTEKLRDGEVVPVQQTSTPVQIDQVLDALDRPSRDDLKVVLDEYGRALDRGWALHEPGDEVLRARRPRFRDRGRRPARARAPRPVRLHPRGRQGQPRARPRPGGAQDADRTSVFVTARGFARESAALEDTLRELPRTLRVGEPALRELDRALPAAAPARRRPRPGRAQLPTRPRREHRDDPPAPRPRVAARAAGPDRRPAPGRPAARAPERGHVALGEQSRAALLLPERGDPALVARASVPDASVPGQGTGLPGAGAGAPGPRRREPLGRRERPVVPRLPRRRQPDLPARSQGEFFQTALPLPRREPAATARQPAPAAASPTVPCETQETPDLDTNPAPPPARVPTSMNTPEARERYGRAKAVAVRWMRDQVRYEGLDELLDVSSDELARGEIGKAGR